MANGIDFNPSTNAAASSGWGGLAGGSNAVNGGQLGGGSTATPGVGGVPSVSSNSSGYGSALPNSPVGGASGTVVPVVGVSSNPAMAGAASSSWNTPVATTQAIPHALGWTEDGSASTDPTIVANRLAKQRANQGPAIYGANGNQTLGEFQQWQADEFNKNQLAAQRQFNAARDQMPYNTKGNLANPYDQYVTNPATPGQASAAFQSPANAAAWNNSGFASQMANPTSLATGNTFASDGGQDYRANQLNFLLQALQNYGPGGQNRFGNGFSPVFTGDSPNGSLMNGLGNYSGNPGGYQSNSGSGSGFSLAQLLPLLIGLAQQPGAGAYGNLG